MFRLYIGIRQENKKGEGKYGIQIQKFFLNSVENLGVF